MSPVAAIEFNRRRRASSLAEVYHGPQDRQPVLGQPCDATNITRRFGDANDESRTGLHGRRYSDVGVDRKRPTQ